MPAHASDQPIGTGQWRPRRVRINAARVPLGASCRAPSTDRLVADGDACSRRRQLGEGWQLASVQPRSPITPSAGLYTTARQHRAAGLNAGGEVRTLAASNTEGVGSTLGGGYAPSTQRPSRPGGECRRDRPLGRCVLGRTATEGGARSQRSRGAGVSRSGRRDGDGGGGGCDHRSDLRAAAPDPTILSPDAARANTPPVPCAPVISNRLDMGRLPGYPNAAFLSSWERRSR